MGAVGGDVRCESGLMRKGQLFTLTLVMEKFGLHGVLDSQGGGQGEEETGQIKY